MEGIYPRRLGPLPAPRKYVARFALEKKHLKALLVAKVPNLLPVQPGGAEIETTPSRKRVYRNYLVSS